MNILIKCFEVFMNFIYCFFKLLPTKNKICFISRQSDKVNIDFRLLVDEIKVEAPDVKIVILTKTLKKGLIQKVKYFFHMFKQMYHIATSKVVILDTYCIMISMLKHKKSLKVIQIWHALGSLKRFGYSTLDKRDGRNGNLAKAMKMHKNYTYILTSSTISRPFFQEAFQAKDEQMKVMSLPRVDFLQSKKEKEQVYNQFYEIYPEVDNKKQNILYCPTQRKEHKVATDELAKQMDLKRYNFIVKLHDGTEKVYVEQKEKMKRKSNLTGLELLHIGDYIITDYSAIIYEAAITQKPIYLYTYDYDTYVDDRGFFIDYETEMPGPICRDFKEILQMIKQGKYDEEKEEKFCHKYVDDLENATKKLTKFILDNMQ